MSDLLELELQVVGRPLTRVLGTELRSSTRVPCALNHRVFAPVPARLTRSSSKVQRGRQRLMRGSSSWNC